MNFPDSSLLWALVVSAFVHALLIALPFGAVSLQKYPSSLHVHLPKPVLSERASPVREEQGAQVAAGPSKLSDIVELTPAPTNLSLPVNAEGGKGVFSTKTQKARLLNPEWLDEAWALPPQAKGDAVVFLNIDVDGGVESIEIEAGGSEFADWLREELPKRAKFSPAYKDGIPVRSTLRIRLDLESLVR